MDISEAVAKRKSTRAYLGTQVSADDLDKIVEAGRWAPNAGPFHISVIRNAELREKINAKTHEAMIDSGVEFLRQRASLPGYEPLYGATVLLVLSTPADAPSGAMNVALAAENMLLQATGLGLASCFLRTPAMALNGTKNGGLAQEAGVPDGYAVQCALIVGHADAQNRFTLDERARKGEVTYID